MAAPPLIVLASMRRFGPQPQIVGFDLNDVANQLIARHKRAA
jgi:hypothetical protein